MGEARDWFIIRHVSGRRAPCKGRFWVVRKSQWRHRFRTRVSIDPPLYWERALCTPSGFVAPRHVDSAPLHDVTVWEQSGCAASLIGGQPAVSLYSNRRACKASLV